MSIYPPCRHFDMICGDEPPWTLRPDETIHNSGRARADKLLEKSRRKFKNRIGCMSNFLSTAVAAHSNKDPMTLAQESVDGFQTAMRLLKLHP